MIQQLSSLIATANKPGLLVWHMYICTGCSSGAPAPFLYLMRTDREHHPRPLKLHFDACNLVNLGQAASEGDYEDMSREFQKDFNVGKQRCMNIKLIIHNALSRKVDSKINSELNKNNKKDDGAHNQIQSYRIVL